MMKRVFLLGGIVSAATLASSGVSAQDVAPLAPAPEQPVATLQQAVEAAIDSQPEVRARWAAFKAAGDDRREAKAGYLPSIDATGEYGVADRSFDGRNSYTRALAEISLSQMLFDGFLTSSRVNQADQSRQARYFELLDAVQQKAFEAIASYEDVRSYRETVDLARQNLEQHAQVLKLMEERTAAGAGPRADLEQAKGRYALAEANLLTEQANLHDVTAVFRRIVGRAPSENLAPFAVAADQVPESFPVVMESATRRNPALYAAHASSEAARYAITEAKSGYFPHVSVGARAGTYRNASGFGSQYDPRSHGEEVFAGVTVNYNLFRGGADKARADAAANRHQQSEDLLDKACVDIRQTASIAWNDVQNLNVKLRSLAAHRDGSAAVAAAYEQQFYIGRRSLLDVLDAKNETFQSRRAYVQAEHELTKANYRTLYSMGTLLDVLGQARPGMPAVGEINRRGNLPASIECTVQTGSFAQ